MGLPGRAFFALLIGAILIDITIVWAQDPPPTAAPPPPKTEPPRPPQSGGDGNNRALSHKFISFEQTIDDIDIFRYEKVEYLMLSDVRTAHQAYLTCEQYSATLAYFETIGLAEFVAEALSETRFILDTLWVAGVLKFDNLTDYWFWHTEDGERKLKDDVYGLIIANGDLKIHTTDRLCLGFGRLDHDKPQLRPLACNARRNVICQRARGKGGRGNSTHPGWIKIGQRLYKIYADLLNHDMAEQTCTMINEDAVLAVVKDYNAAQTLGRYLLIGRPSLENAWIGAIYSGDRYRFEAEQQDLDNVTSAVSKYPPWRYTRMQKPGGCLLLDRHLSNISLFVEARCSRERPVICYRFDKNRTDAFNVSDVIIGPFGYRLVHSPTKIWEQALFTCKDKWGKYNAKLVEIDEPVHKTNLLYTMGENKTAVQHIWIAGQFNTSWKWASDGKAVDEKMLNFVQNQTYETIVEQGNTCLNMDRENHIAAIHYGTNCKYGQAYVCIFPADQLLKLQRDEAEAMDRDTPHERENPTVKPPP